MIGDNAAKMLELLIFVFNGGFQPVIAVQIQNHAALIEPMLAFKGGFYGEGEILFLGGHLQNRGIVVSEMVISPLPEIRMGRGDDLDGIISDFKVHWLACPPWIYKFKHLFPPYKNGAACQAAQHIYLITAIKISQQ